MDFMCLVWTLVRASVLVSVSLFFFCLSSLSSPYSFSLTLFPYFSVHGSAISFYTLHSLCLLFLSLSLVFDLFLFFVFYPLSKEKSLFFGCFLVFSFLVVFVYSPRKYFQISIILEGIFVCRLFPSTPKERKSICLSSIL